MSVENKEKSCVSAVDDLVRVLHQVAFSDGYGGSRQFSMPTFVNIGSVTPSSTPTISAYLVNNACIRFIKRFYEQCKTKEKLCNNAHSKAVLKAVFL